MPISEDAEEVSTFTGGAAPSIYSTLGLLGKPKLKKPKKNQVSASVLAAKAQERGLSMTPHGLQGSTPSTGTNFPRRKPNGRIRTSTPRPSGTSTVA
jgi:hypothetical protein